MKQQKRHMEAHEHLIQISIVKDNLFLLVRVTKHNYFSVLIISANRKSTALFKVTHSLLNKNGQWNICKDYLRHLLDTPARIPSNCISPMEITKAYLAQFSENCFSLLVFRNWRQPKKLWMWLLCVLYLYFSLQIKAFWKTNMRLDLGNGNPTTF